MNEILALFDSNVLPADVVYTPINISKGIIDHLNPIGLCLDKGSEYCELTEGTDFLKYNKKVDWIIGNPPYSIFLEFLEHSFKISDNVSFLVPTNKIFQRQIIMEMINDYGGIKSMIIYGSGQKINFPFGFSVGNFHFKKDYKGNSEVIMGMKKINNINHN